VIRSFAAAIFDMDGLLFDTEAIGRWAWSETLAEMGHTLSDELYRRFLGRDMRSRLQLLRESFGADFPGEQAAARRLTLGDEREVREGVPVKPGALDLVRELHRLGVPVALATGTQRDRALRRLRQAGIAHCFGTVVTSEDVSHGKPAPDIYLETARRLELAPEQCLVFEDSAAGGESALRAGTYPVLVPDLEELPAALLERCERLDSLEHALARLPDWFAAAR